jgi:hypothetical protein
MDSSADCQTVRIAFRRCLYSPAVNRFIARPSRGYLVLDGTFHFIVSPGREAV